MFIPNLARGSHFGMVDPYCRVVFKAYTGQPHVGYVFRFGIMMDPVKRSRGEVPSLLFVNVLIKSFAVLRVYGQRW